MKSFLLAAAVVLFLLLAPFGAFPAEKSGRPGAKETAGEFFCATCKKAVPASEIQTEETRIARYPPPAPTRIHRNCGGIVRPAGIPAIYLKTLALEVKDAPLADVLKALREKAGLQSLASGEVLAAAKPVTLSGEKTVKEILDNACAQAGLSWERTADGVAAIQAKSAAAPALDPAFAKRSTLVVEGSIREFSRGGPPRAFLKAEKALQGRLPAALSGAPAGTYEALEHDLEVYAPEGKLGDLLVGRNGVFYLKARERYRNVYDLVHFQPTGSPFPTAPGAVAWGEAVGGLQVGLRATMTGKVPQGQAIELQVFLKNVGDKPLMCAQPQAEIEIAGAYLRVPLKGLPGEKRFAPGQYRTYHVSVGPKLPVGPPEGAGGPAASIGSREFPQGVHTALARYRDNWSRANLKIDTDAIVFDGAASSGTVKVEVGPRNPAEGSIPRETDPPEPVKPPKAAGGDAFLSAPKLGAPLLDLLKRVREGRSYADMKRFHCIEGGSGGDAAILRIDCVKPDATAWVKIAQAAERAGGREQNRMEKFGVTGVQVPVKRLEEFLRGISPLGTVIGHVNLEARGATDGAAGG